MNEPLFRRISEMIKASGVEIFLVESPDNHYQPEPPEGFRYLRSTKRRVLVPSGAVGNENINTALQVSLLAGYWEPL